MINNVTILGRLTATPELKTTQSGNSVTSFTVAVDRKYTPTGQERQTDFIECVAWRNTAEFIAKYFSKGDMLAVEGKLQTRLYEDKHGNKRKAVEVVVSNVSFCGSKQQSAEEKPSEAPEDYDELDDIGDIPF